MKYMYKTKGTCSQMIEIDLDQEGRISDVQFHGGCSGNLQGISHLVRGMKADDVIARLKGIRCGIKATSCPDQFACALEAIKENKIENPR